MNLETRLDKRLWDAIQASYVKQDFTHAIQDAFYFLSDLIREKTGLSGDGATLVGQAFGGKSPKLRVNKLQSDSERSVQKGLDQLLRGFYQAIRNPRSHEKHIDTAEDAETIILFLNFLIGVIDKSKSPFTKEEFLNSVFEPGFVKSDRYSELLVKEIPTKQLFDIFIAVYRKKETVEDEEILEYFFKALIKVMTDDDVKSACDIVSGEMKVTNSQDAIRHILRFLPSEWWPKYDEVARLRIENKLIQSISDGWYERSSQELGEGGLGSWSESVIRHFSLKTELYSTLFAKLDSSYANEQDYVLIYFFEHLYLLSPEPTPRLKSIVLEGLKSGDIRFYTAVDSLFGSCSEKWSAPFLAAYDSFVVKEQVQGPGGDDIPF